MLFLLKHLFMKALAHNAMHIQLQVSFIKASENDIFRITDDYDIWPKSENRIFLK